MEELYFIGIIPETSIQAAVTTIKEDFKRYYHSSHALKSPPHITLIPPFKCTNTEIVRLSQQTERLCQTILPFNLLIQNFGAFPPHVIFLKLVDNIHLNALQANLEQVLSVHFNFIKPCTRPFHPHMTIAFKDLSKIQFNAAWPIYAQRQFETEFQVHELFLLHFKQKWQVVNSFWLGPKTT